MRRCFELASRGAGFVAPNPLVGAVIVANGAIIGEGWHRAWGNHHAEPNAIANVRDHHLLSQATLYVNLEPCAHQGKTPPCADLIIEKGIARVVIANRDPFKEVNGKGIDRLHSAGVNVEHGCLEHEGRRLNRHFFTFHEKNRPHITLKWAQTSNGFMDRLRVENDHGPFWITSPSTRKIVHLWRSQHSAVLVGVRTALTDDPELTVRDASGRQPVRILLDPDNEAPAGLRIFNDRAPTLVVARQKPAFIADQQWIKAGADNDLSMLMTALHQRNVLSVLVEGGRFTLDRFIEQGLWDEARVLTGAGQVADGLQAPRHHGVLHSRKHYRPDIIETYLNA